MSKIKECEKETGFESFPDSKVSQTPSPFETLKKLKEKESQIHLIRGRYQIFKAHEQKNKNKTIDLERKIEFIEEVKISNEKQKIQKKKISQERMQQIRRKKEINKHLKLNLSLHINQNLKEIRQSKIQERKIIRQASIENQQKINQRELKQIQSKRQKRQTVLQKEQQQKVNVKKYFENKISQTKMAKITEAQELAKKINSRDTEINHLSVKQAQIMVKFSEAITIKKQMNEKLINIYLHQKAKREKERLPDIRSKTVLQKQNGQYKQISD